MEKTSTLLLLLSKGPFFLWLSALRTPGSFGRKTAFDGHPSWRFYPVLQYVVMPKEIPKEIPPELYEIYNDPIGVACFLPPRRCTNCDD
jgi:hypothetical protein